MRRSTGAIPATFSPPITISPVGRLLVAGNHPQDRRLAAAGGPEKAAIGAVGNLQIDAVDHVGDAVIALAETCQFDIAAARAHSRDLNDPSRARRGAC